LEDTPFIGDSNRPKAVRKKPISFAPFLSKRKGKEFSFSDSTRSWIPAQNTAGMTSNFLD